MKIFYILMVCLYTLSAYSQSSTDGTYVFQDATLNSLDYNTRAPVSNNVVNSYALLDSTDMFFRHAFLELTIADGVISSCTLPNQVDYVVLNGILLVPAKTYDSTVIYDENGLDGEDGRRMAPSTTSISGNTLTVTFIFLYGDSRYNFSLEGDLVVTLTKQ